MEIQIGKHTIGLNHPTYFITDISANHDGDAFERPFRFDLAREWNEHMTFGRSGPHFCLGAHLARREIAVAFRTLFRRLPDIAASAMAAASGSQK